MGTGTMELAPEETTSSSSSPLQEASQSARTGSMTEFEDVVLPRRGRNKLAWLATFVPVATAAVALAVHKMVPNRQNATPTGVYARVLVGVMVTFALLGLTQRFWRRMKPTRWNFPIAAIFNL